MSLKKGKQNTANFGNSFQQRLDKETENELNEAFHLFDPNGTNQIDARELKAIMVAFGIQVNKEEIKEIYRSLNKDISDTITKQEYINIVAPRLNSKDSEEEIQRIFKIFDEEGKNRISFQNLKNIAREVDNTLNDEDINEMLEEADKDQDGYINYEEFYAIMRKRNYFDDLDSDRD